MRALTFDRIQPSMKLGKTLYAGDGRVLLHRGTELTQEYLNHLQNQGFTALYVQDGTSPEFELHELVGEQTRQQAVAAVKGSFEDLAGGRKLNQDWVGKRRLYNAATSIVAEVSGNRDLGVQMLELRSLDGYTFQHSVNVCILGMALAIKAGVEHNRLVDLAIGLLLHDIGKLLLPDDLRHLHGQVAPDRRREYERHCEGGYALLKDLGSTFGAPTRIVALHHHERWDGQGFPKGLRGKEIHEFAQICAIADTYDRLTTSSAFGKQAPPHEALEYLMGAGDSLFRLSLVRDFLDIVAPYPLGSTVKLNTGEQGVVVRIEPGLPQRPVLSMVGRSEDFELSRHPDRVIVSLVDL